MCLFFKEGVFLILSISINFVSMNSHPWELSKEELYDLAFPGNDLVKLPDRCYNQVNQFLCDSLQSCIEYPLVCDGFKDCPDGSDETEQECAKKNCSKNEFRCSYGGCISVSGKCDGRTDCADNSDETNADCPPIINEVVTIEHCKANQFQCLSSRNCIDKQLVCDGKGNCDDNSDETAEQCENTICPGSTFRCEYGACIDGEGKCNGKKDCFDGSDEFEQTCIPEEVPVTKRPTIPVSILLSGFSGISNIPDPEGGCTLPDDYKHAKIKINCPKENPKCASNKSRKVKLYTEVKYHCDEGYDTAENRSEFISICWKGSWVPGFKTCKKTCKILKPENVDLNCIYNGLEVSCKEKMLEGTAVRPQCKAFHHPAQLVHYKRIHCESNGRWTDELFRCVPDCGKPIINNVKTQIAQARKEEYGEAPWHVSIYCVKASNRPLICGGTLISPHLVVSAAHCFFEENIQKLNNVKDYEIAVSKYSRQYSQVDNRYTKKYKIREIILSNNSYTGDSTRYASDIAILWVNEEISINQAVLPACVDWTGGDQFKPGEGSVGRFTGIGSPQNETSNKFRQITQLPFISRNKCVKTLPHDFKDIVTLDKYCAGSANGSGPHAGDSGGGLLFRDLNFGVYFLHGIVSIRGGPSSSVPVFTNIYSYLDWIDEVRRQVQSSHVNQNQNHNQNGKKPLENPENRNQNNQKPKLQTVVKTKTDEKSTKTEIKTTTEKNQKTKTMTRTNEKNQNQNQNQTQNHNQKKRPFWSRIF